MTLGALDQPVPGWVVVGALALAWLAFIAQTRLAALESAEEARRSGATEARPSIAGRVLLWGVFLALSLAAVGWAAVDVLGA